MQASQTSSCSFGIRPLPLAPDGWRYWWAPSLGWMAARPGEKFGSPLPDVLAARGVDV